MPRVRWGISASDVDDFDRSSQYTPYRGPIPPNGVYDWEIKILRYVAATRETNEQIRVGIELAPREGNKAERQYAGYFFMDFLHITPKTQWRYVPFLDALGVSGRDLTERTVTDNDGNIRRIGSFKMGKGVFIAAQLADDHDDKGNPRKKISWYGPVEEDSGEYDDDDGNYSGEEVESDEEEMPF